MSRRRSWWTELTVDGRPWSVRHPTDLVRRAAYLARVRRTAGQADALAAETMAGWDHDAFIARFRPYWDPFPTKRPPKYLDLKVHMQESAERCLSLGLFEDGGKKRILDLGCGPGYFLAACRSLGHEVLGVDLDDQPLYNDLIDFLAIPRIIHRVTPSAPLPPLDGPFDIVTAFGVVFNFEPGPTGGSWPAADWDQVLATFVDAVVPGGKVVIHFNADSRTGQVYPSGLRRLLARRPGIEARFFGEHLEITRGRPSEASAS